MNISLYARLLRFSIAFGLIALSGCNSNDPQSPVIGNNAPSISDLNEGNQIQAEYSKSETNYYAILGVNRNSDPDEIVRSFSY